MRGRWGLRRGSGMALAAGLAALVALAGGARAEDGVTDTTIRIGMYGPLTGAASIWGYPTQDGAIMVYKEANDKGGVNGRKFEIVQEDGACDAAKTVAAVKKLISRDKVFLINSGMCSGPTMAVKDDVAEQTVPLMVFAASLDQITAPVNRYIFTVAPTGGYDGKSMAAFLQTVPNIKRIAMIGHSDDWAKAKRDAFLAAIKGSGIEIVANETIDRKATDATPQILAVKKQNPDAVALFTYPAESAAVLRDAKKYGLDTVMIGNNSLIDLPALAERAGGADAVQKTYVMASLVGPIGSPQMQPYETLLKKYFPDQKVTADAFYGTASAITVVNAIEKAGRDLTRDKLVDALQSLHGFDPGIAPCKITLSAADHQGCQEEIAWKLVGDKVVTVGVKWHEVK